MPNLNPREIERYLRGLTGAEVSVERISSLGEGQDVKSYGYGVPVRVDLETDHQTRSTVLHTIRPAAFGHEHMADRAQELLWEHRAFNALPRHIRSLDVFGFRRDGGLVSLGNVEEFGLLTEYVEGRTYAEDLERLLEGGRMTELDFSRADALCDYLIEIHTARDADQNLYTRRIRELVGGNQCIMGIIDSYGRHPLAQTGILKRIEQSAINWRWKLKNFTHRLRQVHGDFHPWNILFRSNVDFSVLDRSRGEYGEPADDVTSLTLNYVFFSLQQTGKLEGSFGELFLRFWKRYLERSCDREMLEVAAPFFAFRGLVMASPVWYPALSNQVREKLLRFVIAVLESDVFDPGKVNDYCGA